MLNNLFNKVLEKHRLIMDKCKYSSHNEEVSWSIYVNLVEYLGDILISKTTYLCMLDMIR